MPVAPSFELFGRDGSLFALADGNTVPFSLRVAAKPAAERAKPGVCSFGKKAGAAAGAADKGAKAKTKGKAKK